MIELWLFKNLEQVWELELALVQVRRVPQTLPLVMGE
jgi:hypothetical protein